MFPTLSSLIKYLTGANLSLPIQTFGCFVALAFWLSYLAFKKEFIRKEQLNLIYPFSKKITSGTATAAFTWIGYTLAGFIVGYKIVFCLLHYKLFARFPASCIFSWRGNFAGGLVTGIAFFLWVYVQSKRQQLATSLTTTSLIHPYEFTDKLLLWCAAVGFAGALLFAKLEYIHELFETPLKFFSEFNGLTFYGGLIFGAGIYLYLTKKKMGIPFLIAADIGSPGMMLAYAVGRMGCHLSGDGDWGIVNTAPKPSWLALLPHWAWSYNYPHNVIHQGKYIEGCADNYCNVLTQPVFPTSLYESVICLLLFAALWLTRNKIKKPGLMFFIFILCNGIERFFIEFIKTNSLYCIQKICFTQAQFIALFFCMFGIGGLLWLKGKKDIEIKRND